MPITFQNREPLVDAQQISRIESKLSVQFPGEYREFLMAHNVAVPEPNQFISSTITTSVELFFGLSKTPLNDFFEQNHVVYAERLPNGVLAIARAGGGNLICLSLSGGSVYFWDRKREATNSDVPGFENMTLLVPSMSEFLGTLTKKHGTSSWRKSPIDTCEAWLFTCRRT